MAISAYNLSHKASGNLSPPSPDKSTLTVELDKLATTNMNADERVSEEERYVKQVSVDTVVSEAAKARWAELDRYEGDEEGTGNAKKVPVPEDKTAGNGNIPESPPPPAASESFTDPLVGKFIRVKGGTFTMGCTSEQGSDCYDDEKPAHEVTLSDYYLGETEVTQAQWRAVMGNNPSNFKDCDECPVERVSWNDVKDFISKLNSLSRGARYRLPTEAEWEYAARGGSLSKGYKYAGSDEVDEVAWYDDNSGYKTHPVRMKKSNELGIYDMSGNVREWCSDWKSDYSSGSQTNPTGPNTGGIRVYRGGGWGSLAGNCRVSNRDNDEPDVRYGILGFRLASPAPR
jgi:formylglycine-generating enzyme required for sulfatase activity